MPNYTVVRLSSNQFSADPVIGSEFIDVPVDLGGNVANLSDLLDVDTSNLNSQTNKYVMIYDSITKVYKFVNPDNVVDSAAGVSTDRATNFDPAPIGFSTESLNYLDTELDNRIDLDAGTF